MKKFEHLKSQYKTLCKNLNKDDYSEKNLAYVTSEFDRVFELSWKTMREYLKEELGILEASSGSPKVNISLAYKEGLISDESVWREMLKDRNDDTHLYSMTTAAIYFSKIIDKYLIYISKLIDVLNELIPEDEFIRPEIPSDLIKHCQENNISLYIFINDYKSKYGLNSDLELIEHWNKRKKADNIKN